MAVGEVSSGGSMFSARRGGEDAPAHALALASAHPRLNAISRAMVIHIELIRPLPPASRTGFYAGFLGSG